MKKDDPYYGFSVSSIAWGYRDLFKKIIDELFNKGYLGEKNKDVTEHFFSLMRCSEKELYDHVLKEFLEALNKKSAWILELPSIFKEIVKIGSKFSDFKLYYGIQFFKNLGEGSFGESPEEVNCFLKNINKLIVIDIEFAFSLINSFKFLLDSLGLDEITLFVKEGIIVFNNNKNAGKNFIECKLKESKNVIESISTESRLSDRINHIKLLIKALSGIKTDIEPISVLDSSLDKDKNDEAMLVFYTNIFLPEHIRIYSSKIKNQELYDLISILISGMLNFNSFPKIHGSEKYPSIFSLLDGSIENLNILIICEYLRIFKKICLVWPGVENLLKRELQRELISNKNLEIDKLFLNAALNKYENIEHKEFFENIINNSESIFDTIILVNKKLDVGDNILSYFKGKLLRTYLFLPNFLFETQSPYEFSNDFLLYKKESEKGEGDDDNDEKNQESSDIISEIKEQIEEISEEEQKDSKSFFIYDEWSQDNNDYFKDYCHVFEVSPFLEEKKDIPVSLTKDIERIKKVFESVKPAEYYKLKNLEDGDEINNSLLTEFIIKKKLEPNPEVDFYEKKYIYQRDLSVMILIDLSGSTGEENSSQKAIDLEKYASLILGYGLDSLGDNFSLCGFSGTGREDCKFIVFKDFMDKWDNDSVQRLLNAFPISSTRIGAALRHSGAKLDSIY